MQWTSVLIPLTLGSLCVLGQTLPPRQSTVEASGDAVVQVKPDQAILAIGVVTQAATAQEAGAQNANQTQAALDRLRPLVGTKGSIRTLAYSLNPVYSEPRSGSQPTIRAYSANNTVQVTTSDLEGLGKLIDAATQGGANRIQGVQFTVKDEAPSRGEALGQAVKAARANAEAMAAASGQKLGRLLNLQQGNAAVIRPAAREFVANVAFAPTPVESGTVEVRAAVTVTFELQ